MFTLEEGEPDATVDDICKFIVEYINSDVVVRSLQVFIPSQRLTHFVQTTGLAREPASHHRRSVEGVMVLYPRY